MLQGLPVSVKEIAITHFGSEIERQSGVLSELVVVVEQLPQGNALRIVRVVTGIIYFERNPCTWRGKIQRSDQLKVEKWRLFTQSAARLLELGVVVVDEDDVLLTDFLRELPDMEEP